MRVAMVVASVGCCLALSACGGDPEQATQAASASEADSAVETTDSESTTES